MKLTKTGFDLFYCHHGSKLFALISEIESSDLLSPLNARTEYIH